LAHEKTNERQTKMRHQDLTINHILESWVYANATARTGATGFVSGDVGRIAFQTDTGQYFRLLSTSPTWELIAPYTPLSVGYASLQTAQASPTGSATASPGVMMGLAVGHTITPVSTGKILVMFDGAIGNNVALKLAAGQIRYGSTTPPVNGSVGTVGTPNGGQFIASGSLANETAPLSSKALVTGLTIGAAYWFDLQLWTSPGGIAIVTGVTISAVELP
jgi:hypothetical protein